MQQQKQRCQLPIRVT